MKVHVPQYLVRLREATRHIHSTVEESTDSERMLGQSPDFWHYRQFIASHYLLHKQIAQHSACLGDHGVETGLLDWPDCPRISALESDLDQLKFNVNVLAYPNLPSETHGFTLGLVYVCEGSCIGNQRVLAALKRHECFHHWNSKSFLSTCKEGFSGRWKTLLASMNQLSTYHSEIDGSGYDELEKGAIAGFNIYLKYWCALDGATTA